MNRRLFFRIRLRKFAQGQTAYIVIMAKASGKTLTLWVKTIISDLLYVMYNYV